MERSKLLEALKKYPTIEVLFGKDWFLRNILEKEENRYPLVEFLLEEPDVNFTMDLFNDAQNFLKTGKIKDFTSIDSEINELLYSSEFLKNLDNELGKLKEVEGLSRIVERLRESVDPVEFLLIVDEIEVASSLRECFDGIEIETRVEQYLVDLKVNCWFARAHFYQIEILLFSLFPTP